MRRLEVAQTASEVLDEKRRALLRERGRLEGLVEDARLAWESAAADAAEWLERANVLSGRRCVDLARFHGGGQADLRVEWRNSLGVLIPSETRFESPGAAGVVGVGGSAALPVAAAAHRRALAAAVDYSAVKVAFDRISEELAVTTRRLQAIERRWIPQHERALATLELALDEAEREDATRTRWAVHRLAGE